MLTMIDYVTLIVYFVIVIGLGLYLTGKASGSISEYFLGGRHIPWYILGISGMATFLSLSGSMHVVSLYFVFGVKGFWATFRGHIVLFLAFLMIFMGKWLNRSGVMTNAEWILFRFGDGTDGRIARLLAAISNIVVAVAIMAFFVVAAEKFFGLYLPFPPKVCALLFFAIVMVYTVSAGFYGVVYTDLLQSVLVVAIIGFVTVKAMSIGTAEYFAEFTTPEWHSLMPKMVMDMPEGYESMKFFGLLVIFWTISNIFMGFGQPTDGFVSQRYYAARNERESSLIAWQWIVLLSLRFLMMTGVAVLALGIVQRFTDPEQAFPAVIDYYFPAGMKGIVLAGLIAAEMSSLDSIANSTAAYVVKDIYQEFFRPDASDRTLMKASYITTAVLFIISLVIGLTVSNLNSLWAWIVMGLVTGILPPGILKWFWWRFNGTGYAFGIGSGIMAAILHTVLFADAPEYVTFAFVLSVSTIGTVAGTFLGKPCPMPVLVNFYTKTRPFGWWKPVQEVCDNETVASIRRETRRDLLLLIPACVWQAAMFWMMSALVVKNWMSFGISAGIVAVLSWVLYKYWYKNL